MSVRVGSSVAVTMVAALAVAGFLGVLSPVARAATVPGRGSFYDYLGRTPLAEVAPGTVLKTRTLSYHVAGIALPVQVVQLLYRSAGALGQPKANVTSVLEPPVRPGSPRAVSYQSFYDSLNPADEPSAQIAGDVTLGGLVTDAESVVIAPLLLQGYTVIVPDTEGQTADFAAGPEYGINTLNSIRAATSSPLTGLTTSTPIGMFGYSGGAIATDWAAQLAPTYAPDVNRQLVGAAEGGVLVDPAHNLTYVNGSQRLGGHHSHVHHRYRPGFPHQHHALPEQLTGASSTARFKTPRSPTSWASTRGLRLPSWLNHITQIRPASPSWSKSRMSSIPGSLGSPTIPMFIGQGADGILEGTPGNKPGIGPGDGVMVAGDVRTLARDFCASGTAVDYTQYDALSHITTFPVWTPAALAWLDSRFAGSQAPNDCSQIAPGNSLAPVHPAG